MDVYKPCPKCGEKTYVVSVFGTICANCDYRGEDLDPQTSERSNALEHIIMELMS